ncbi:beta-galactosidase [Pedobacter changchengzhani]|uniref:Beta-galactosidase n=1 Tax=Pedobacter changchengzhani TaxID=2529274 RepID=A0A4V3A0E7_9SPHI|nr:sugar-binding domain-containing protein [Pedobacter changchengzhani]TDG37293.1 beta-galactosidase [Pedobacter changchengzhani]
MKLKFKTIILLALLSISSPLFAQWKPAGDKIKTEWGEKLNPKNVLAEYPRPIMARQNWKNLNGLWNYAITDTSKAQPANFDGKILVPFAAESSLSGVMKNVGASKDLWYNTTFTIPSDWKGKDVLLNFGAVDWRTEVWINDKKVGTHEGGYSPFSFNITKYLSKSAQKITVKVWDPTDEGPQPRGKQLNNPNSIWYTPVTGIWQTVWLEPVAKQHITALKTVADIDKGVINITPKVFGGTTGDLVEVKIMDGGKLISSTKMKAGKPISIAVKNAKLWSPESPFLYKMKVKLWRKGTVLDEVKSYFAMRKLSTGRDAAGIMRLELNNKSYFQFGTLDQGWWPDGLYTAPSDEALKYDIVKTKAMGFNMIRKHIKVEPARWYTHCDEIGMLVWQDMPSGDKDPNWQGRGYFNGKELIRTAKSEAIYRKEWKEIIDNLYSYPSIAVWVPFNEAWGQFKTPEIAKWTKEYDPSRLVNPASGGNHYKNTGDMVDIHQYPAPVLEMNGPDHVTVLGEYGGIGLPIKGHLWNNDKNWGYIELKNSAETTAEYVKYAKQLEELAKKGISAAVYTQTTDVEGEINGFMTYDRKIDKLDVPEVKKANEDVIKAILP